MMAFLAPLPPPLPERPSGSGKAVPYKRRHDWFRKVGTERLINGPGFKPWVKEVFVATIGLVVFGAIVVWQHS